MDMEMLAENVYCMQQKHSKTKFWGLDFMGLHWIWSYWTCKPPKYAHTQVLFMFTWMPASNFRTVTSKHTPGLHDTKWFPNYVRNAGGRVLYHRLPPAAMQLQELQDSLEMFQLNNCIFTLGVFIYKSCSSVFLSLLLIGAAPLWDNSQALLILESTSDLRNI